MENSRLDDTKLLAIIGLLLSFLIVVSVSFGLAYFYDVKHNGGVDVGSCISVSTSPSP
ncbi:hypothetical protein SJI19_15670 [Acerihabitans sp. TG2]|uniref:hypothetical protein n=1 Tax=Acerihabitans sp. TG2 TaxID=3096008 RepID=UPI002B23458B|nr:hypothetical protein [Acerihabitans sp. TG2]MEA9391965.1 hypothetical protein [Acerihabitans sp. TG2]